MEWGHFRETIFGLLNPANYSKPRLQLGNSISQTCGVFIGVLPTYCLLSLSAPLPRAKTERKQHARRDLNALFINIFFVMLIRHLANKLGGFACFFFVAAAVPEPHRTKPNVASSCLFQKVRMRLWTRNGNVSSSVKRKTGPLSHPTRK